VEEERSGALVDDFDFDFFWQGEEEFLTHKFSFLGSFPPGQFPSRELF
jgi:hypothetical protein